MKRKDLILLALLFLISVGIILYTILTFSLFSLRKPSTISQISPIKINQSTSFSLRASLEKNLKEVLSLWSKALGKELKFEDFKFYREENFKYPFNEVALDGREKRIPGWKEATVYSPDRKMWVNCLYSYEKPKFSSCILFNPKGEGRYYRIAFCALTCKFYKAWWLDSNNILIAEILKDPNCNSLNCPETLGYRVYDLNQMKFKEFVYRESLGKLSTLFPQAICSLYPPCERLKK